MFHTVRPRSARHTGRTVQAAAVAMTGLLVLSACSDDSDNSDDSASADSGTAGTDTADTDTGTGDSFATANVANGDGDELGTATLSTVDGGSELAVEFSGLEPGMYGMHMHSVGACEPDSVAPDDEGDPDAETGDFLSAGGHLGADDHDHPDHGGDLPALLVNENGEGTLTVTTDRIEEDNLLDDDGSTLIVHEDPDNYGNVPDRYAPDGPDEDTLSTGDAGDRQGCGVFE